MRRMEGRVKRINTHLSRCYVNRFVEDQPYSRLPTTGVSRAALVSHVTVRVWKEALQRQVTYGRSIACTEREQSLVTNIYVYIHFSSFEFIEILCVDRIIYCSNFIDASTSNQDYEFIFFHITFQLSLNSSSTIL